MPDRPRQPLEGRRHASELGSWEMATRRPHSALAGQEFRIAGSVERTRVPLSRLEAPFSGIVVILSFDEQLRIVDALGRDPVHTSFTAGARGGPSFPAGLSDGPTFTEHAGSQHGMQVDLSPPAARALLGVPLRELTNSVVAL